MVRVMKAEATAKAWSWLSGSRTVCFIEAKCLLEDARMRSQGAGKAQRSSTGVDPATPEMEIVVA